MDDLSLIGPIERRLGRWMLDRLVATAVRYGHPFALVFARTPVPDATARALTRLGDAAPEAELSGVTWNGDLADDLLERAFRGAGSVNPR